ILNDEFGRDFLGELVGHVSLPSQQLHEYALMQHKNAPARYLSHIPYSVLNSAREEARPATLQRGISHLGEKQDCYTTTAGSLSLATYNARAAAFRPAQMADDYRFLCDTSIKFEPDSARVQALYQLEQRRSRLLDGRGAGLTQADIEALRAG